MPMQKQPELYEFLLTRLLRGATHPRRSFRLQEWNFYSHASCEARQTE